MLLLIDNYDSFVYNLARYVGELGFERKVARNDKITLQEIALLKPTHIIISPGPCDPSKAGISLDVIRHFAGKIPILGICLGHQAIGQAYGGEVVKGKKPVHGKTSFITHNESDIFQGVSNPLKVARYHSLIVRSESLPKELIITAQDGENTIMGLKHAKYPVYGVQFHPESIITDQGYNILSNFLNQTS
jgi:anthranilate synthase/aminodeoxychorismate synthase-like glutamine amidotransferase